MQILVINSGSSSIKAAVVDGDTGRKLVRASAERVGTAEARWSINGELVAELGGADHEAMLAVLLPALLEVSPRERLGGVGHRVVHGGTEFDRPVRIDDDVVSKLESLVPLAPLHNPANIAGVRAARALLPELAHVAVFDTAFHSTLPRRARTYAIPAELAEKHGVRRFGFHGPSHRYVAELAADALRADLRDLRLVTLHLGNGCSAAAVEYGRSVETSMGMTPLEGLVMGTRCGDIDPGALIAIARAEGWGMDELDRLVNRESGLAGLSGLGNDMRDIEERAGEGDERARLALQVFAHRVRKYIGSYAAVMGGVDAIVFTGGIGENSALLRHRVGQRLGFLGATIDEDANQSVRLSSSSPVADFSEAHSRCKLLAVRTDEEHAIASRASELVRELDKVTAAKTIPIAISARHVHLTQASVEALFGPGHQLTEYKPLSQPGQFASHDRVTLRGPRRSIEKVRVLGPARGADQVEISRTDEFFLGMDAPVRRSGDIENTPGIILEGPAGTVELKDGVICAWRHIHMTPEDADAFGVCDGDVVEVEVSGTGRGLIFGDVLVRVKDSYALEMHIDTDEGNAAELPLRFEGVLHTTSSVATMRRKRARAERAAPNAAE